MRVHAITLEQQRFYEEVMRAFSALPPQVQTQIARYAGEQRKQYLVGQMPIAVGQDQSPAGSLGDLIEGGNDTSEGA